MDQWTTGPMDQWSNGPIEQWTNGLIDQWTNGPMDQWTRNSCDPMQRKTHWNIGSLWHLNIGSLKHWKMGTFDIQSASICILGHLLHWYCLSDLGLRVTLVISIASMDWVKIWKSWTVSNSTASLQELLSELTRAPVGANKCYHAVCRILFLLTALLLKKIFLSSL